MNNASKDWSGVSDLRSKLILLTVFILAMARKRKFKLARAMKRKFKLAMARKRKLKILIASIVTISLLCIVNILPRGKSSTETLHVRQNIIN